MRALIQSDAGPRLVRDHPEPARGGEATIRPRLCGLCATDLEITRGYLGFRGVLGHEWVGEVVDAPDRAWVGRRVVGEINCSCGQCPTCRAGRPTHCPDRSVFGIVGRDGAFADRFSLPIENLHEVPASIPDEAAVFTEPLAAACEILQQVAIRPTDRVVVLGLGRLGQLCARVVALTGAEVFGVARNPARFALLPRGVIGVPLEQLPELRGVDVVVEATGAAAGLATATRIVRPRGTIVLKSTVHDAGAQTATPWILDEVTLVGSRCGPFAPALRLLAAGLVDPRPLISRRCALDEGVQALAAAAAPGVGKVLLAP